MNPPKSSSILIPTFKSVTLIDPLQVTYIRAMQNYCKLHQLDGSQVLVSISFGKVLNLFSDFAFHQCHRSYAVNGRHFIKLHKSLKIEMDCGGMVPVARRRKRAFLEGLG